MSPPTGPGGPAVHVWSVDLEQRPEDVAGLGRSLSRDETARARAFRSPAHQRRFVVARGALRSLLSERLDTPPSAIRFTYGDHGRPELPDLQNPADIRFNVSHSHELALIAVTAGARVGVDVEHVRPLRDLDALISRFFSAEEARSLAPLAPQDRLAAFYACWTRKEAYLKATGSGLTVPLDRFTVSVAPGEAPRMVHIDGDAAAAKAWRLVDVSPRAGYCATLAVEATDGQVVANHWIPAPR